MMRFHAQVVIWLLAFAQPIPQAAISGAVYEDRNGNGRRDAGNHAREQTVLGVDGRTPTRFEQTGAVVGPGGSPWMPMASGVTVYRVRGGTISAGEFVRLDPTRQ